MNETISGILESSRVISSPQTPATPSAETPPSTDSAMPFVAEILGLTAFYQEKAPEVLPPDKLFQIRENVAEIERYANSHFKFPNPARVEEYLADIITKNGLQNLKPVKRLEKIMLHIDLDKRLTEIKNIKKLLKDA